MLVELKNPKQNAVLSISTFGHEVTIGFAADDESAFGHLHIDINEELSEELQFAEALRVLGGIMSDTAIIATFFKSGEWCEAGIIEDGEPLPMFKGKGKRPDKLVIHSWNGTRDEVRKL